MNGSAAFLRASELSVRKPESDSGSDSRIKKP